MAFLRNGGPTLHKRTEVKCWPADRRTGKLRTKLADPACGQGPPCPHFTLRVASCHRPLVQRCTSYLAGPRLHTWSSLHFPFSFPSSPVPSPFPSLPFPSPLWAPSERKTNLVHFRLKIWHLVAPIFQSNFSPWIPALLATQVTTQSTRLATVTDWCDGPLMTGEVQQYSRHGASVLWKKIVQQINFCLEFYLGCQSNSLSVTLKECNWQKSGLRKIVE